MKGQSMFYTSGSIKVRSLITVLALIGAVPATAQSSTQWRTQPADNRYRSADSKDAVVEFSEYVRCFVDNRHERARAIVLAPYGSQEQEAVADIGVKDEEDTCFRPGDDMRLTFSATGLAGGLAQVLVLKSYPDLSEIISSSQTDPKDEAAQLAKMNAAEIFGRCVVQGNPSGVLGLIKSPIGSSAEGQAVRTLSGDLSKCLAQGSELAITKTFLRNVTSVAAFRLAHQIMPRGVAGPANRK